MGPQGLQGLQGPDGQPGPAGVAGVQGPQGAPGPAFADLPAPAELLHNVSRAARDLSPRILVDPRVQVRYATRLTSSLLKLQGGLFLRAMMTASEAEDTDVSQVATLRSIA
jgi:hypothetical protein